MTAKTSRSTATKHYPLQNSSLIWLDATIDLTDGDSKSKLQQLRNVIYEVHVFHELDECVDYLTDIDTQ
jgi:hypothetical protein